MSIYGNEYDIDRAKPSLEVKVVQHQLEIGKNKTFFQQMICHGKNRKDIINVNIIGQIIILVL